MDGASCQTPLRSQCPGERAELQVSVRTVRSHPRTLQKPFAVTCEVHDQSLQEQRSGTGRVKRTHLGVASLETVHIVCMSKTL
ncbi:hypothetical protein chiPu_0005184 [Chiloscyllium punctatum]|uniref:Uncharacterized protein n=1 Tax=Chiloscyllium punctatum TaxID=137246 RepID=A0A401S8P0_CHIPU|nr:hypothetical protein [Chiloscyllium punctatum]